MRKKKIKFFEDCDVRFVRFPNMKQELRKQLEEFYKKIHGDHLTYKPEKKEAE